MAPLTPALAACALIALAGCAGSTGARSGWGPGTTTAYSSYDLAEAADQARADLLSSDFITARTGASPRIVLRPGSLRNESSERIAVTDQRAALTRLLYDPLVVRTLGERNIGVLRVDGGEDRPAAPGAGPGEPTHALNALFRSVKRAAGLRGRPADQRKDVFVIDYAIVDLNTGRIEWTTGVTLARQAEGLLVD